MKIDLHTHAKLSKASDFSKVYYEEMIREALDNGLDALALTEHFNTRHFEEVYQLDRMFPYNGEYYDADGLKIFPGMEVDIRETGHILLIGRKEYILETRRQLDGYTEKGSFIPFDDLMDLAEAFPRSRSVPIRSGEHAAPPSHPQSVEPPGRLRSQCQGYVSIWREANQDQVQRFAPISANLLRREAIRINASNSEASIMSRKCLASPPTSLKVPLCKALTSFMSRTACPLRSKPPSC